MMSAYVVDTNVPLVANGFHEKASVDCVLACIALLRKVRNAIVCLDDLGKILAEYNRKLNIAGQPGVGDEFYRWLHERQAMPEHCERVQIHSCHESHEPENYEEFPSDPELASFDPSDRKFVAVALTSKYHPPIVNATDSDWWNQRAVLERNGITIQFLCPDAF
jgi:hypothetical protein